MDTAVYPPPRTPYHGLEIFYCIVEYELTQVTGKDYLEMFFNFQNDQQKSTNFVVRVTKPLCECIEADDSG